MVLDSEDVILATKNKRMSITTLNSFQSLQNTVIVRSAADLPDAIENNFINVENDGSGNAQFVFSSAHNFSDGQIVEILNSSVVAYDGFHTIKFIDTFKFSVIGLTFSTDANGDTVRCLDRDTAYIIAAQILTVNGYRQVGVPSPPSLFNVNAFDSTNIGKNLISMVGNNKTFLTSTGKNFMHFNNMFIVDFTKNNTLFNITGTRTFIDEGVLPRVTGFDGFKFLGTVSNTTFGETFNSFTNFQNPFIFNNVNFGSSHTLIAPTTTAAWIEINNLNPNDSISTQITALDPNITDSSNSILKINPATPKENTFVITDSGQTGGNYFEPRTFSESNTITGFAAAPSPRNLTHTVVTVPNTLATGQDNNQKARISQTTNYNGDFLITTVIAFTSFEIAIPFVSAETSGLYQRLRFIFEYSADIDLVSTLTGFADNGKNGTTITASATLPAGYFDNRRITITGTTKFDGQFRIFNVTTTTFDILKTFETGGTTGTGTIKITDLGIFGHGFPIGPNRPFLIDKSINYDEGVIGEVTGGATVKVDLPFTVDDQTGELLEGSLTPRATNVLLDTVSGELNSKAKGSFSLNNNNTATTITVIGKYETLVLDDNAIPPILKIPLVNETRDTELFRLISTTNGILEYRGLEPFSGQLLATMSVTGGNGNTYTFRALRNNALMVDGTESSVKLGNIDARFSYQVSISAVTGDQFKLQVKNDALTDITIKTLTVVIE